MRETTLPVSANNSQISLSEHLSAYTSAPAHYNMDIFSVQNQSISYEGNWDTRACLNGFALGRDSVYEPGRSGRLWTYFETFNKCFDFPDGEYIFVK